MASTDCRSEEGITVGLIDSVITICRVLRTRLSEDLSVAEKEALKDLASDEDFLHLIERAAKVTTSDDMLIKFHELFGLLAE